MNFPMTRRLECLSRCNRLSRCLPAWEASFFKKMAAAGSRRRKFGVIRCDMQISTIKYNDDNNKPSAYGSGLPFAAWMTPHGVHPMAATVFVPWGTLPPAGIANWTPVLPVVPIAESEVVM